MGRKASLLFFLLFILTTGCAPALPATPLLIMQTAPAMISQPILPY